MKMWKMLSLVFLLAACTGGTSEVQNTAGFTLQLVKKDEQRAALMLCQGNTCQNPLQKIDGSEFYFQNHVEAYNTATSGLKKGQAARFALLGVSVIAGAAGIYYMFRNWRLLNKVDDIDARLVSKRIDEVEADITSLDNELREAAKDVNKFEATILDKTGKQVTIKKTGEDANGDAILEITRSSDGAANPAADASDELNPEDYALLYKQRDDLAKQADDADRNGWIGWGASIAAWGATFIPGLAGDRHWKHKRRTFEQLFIHGNRVTVSQAETRALLEVITSSMPATAVTPQVKQALVME